MSRLFVCRQCSSAAESCELEYRYNWNIFVEAIATHCNEAPGYQWSEWWGNSFLSRLYTWFCLQWLQRVQLHELCLQHWLCARCVLVDDATWFLTPAQVVLILCRVNHTKFPEFWSTCAPIVRKRGRIMSLICKRIWMMPWIYFLACALASMWISASGSKCLADWLLGSVLRDWPSTIWA